MKKTAFIFLLALLCGTAQAQGSDPLVMIYKSPPAVSLSYAKVRVLSSDANGDGTADLILTAVNPDSTLQGIRVVDVASGNTLWEVQDITLELGLNSEQVWRLLGFVDPQGDSVKDALFVSEQDVVLINPTNNSLVWRWGQSLINMGADANGVLVGVTDMTGDGYVEIIIYLPVTRQVELWSKP